MRRVTAEQLDRYLETQTGNHGFDPRLMPEMNGILYGVGPNIKAGARIGPVENIEIYPLIARILGLQIEGKIDASGQLAKKIYWTLSNVSSNSPTLSSRPMRRRR